MLFYDIIKLRLYHYYYFYQSLLFYYCCYDLYQQPSKGCTRPSIYFEECTVHCALEFSWRVHCTLILSFGVKMHPLHPLAKGQPNSKDLSMNVFLVHNIQLSNYTNTGQTEKLIVLWCFLIIKNNYMDDITEMDIGHNFWKFVYGNTILH